MCPTQFIASTLVFQEMSTSNCIFWGGKSRWARCRQLGFLNKYFQNKNFSIHTCVCPLRSYFPVLKIDSHFVHRYSLYYLFDQNLLGNDRGSVAPEGLDKHRINRSRDIIYLFIYVFNRTPFTCSCSDYTALIYLQVV